MPASGENTRTEMRVSVVLKGIFGLRPSCGAAVLVMVVPAKTSAPAARTTLTTWLAALAGSATMDESSAPPKPMKP